MPRVAYEYLNIIQELLLYINYIQEIQTLLLLVELVYTQYSFCSGLPPMLSKPEGDRSGLRANSLWRAGLNDRLV